MKRPIICMPAIDWGYLFHRPQQLMLSLAERGHPVYYLNPNQVPGSHPEQVRPNLWVIKDNPLLPAEIVNSAVFFIYLPWFIRSINPNDNIFVVYDCIDDDPVFNGHEEYMLSRSDLVICVSQLLMEKHKGRHRQLLFMPNGVDIVHYQQNLDLIPVEIASLKENCEVLLGFTGAFFNGWVDIPLLYWLAETMPAWSIAIIGETYGWDFSKAPENIHPLGRKGYAELPRYMHCFDAGIIPFMDNQIAQGADPIKMYEYLAAGIPVVSRDLPYAKDLVPPLVYRYQSAEEFLQQINNAVRDDGIHRVKNRKERLDFISGFTWQSRADLVLSRLKNMTWLDKEEDK